MLDTLPYMLCHPLLFSFLPSLLIVDSKVSLVDYLELFNGIGDWNLFMDQLNLPCSVYESIKQRHNNPSQCRIASLKWYQSSHPAPSWRHVADALYLMGEHDILDALSRDIHYLKGKYGIYVSIMLSPPETRKYVCSTE